MKSLEKHMSDKEGLWGKTKMVVYYDWIFSSYFEKAVISAMFFWSVYSIGRFLLSL